TLRPTWSCRVGSARSACTHTPPNCSPPSTSGLSSMSHSPTATLRLLLIWNARSQSVAGSSKAISSNPGQASTGGPSQLSRPNQPETVLGLGWGEIDTGLCWRDLYRAYVWTQGSRMKACDPMLGADFGELAAPEPCLAGQKTRP